VAPANYESALSTTMASAWPSMPSLTQTIATIVTLVTVKWFFSSSPSSSQRVRLQQQRLRSHHEMGTTTMPMQRMMQRRRLSPASLRSNVLQHKPSSKLAAASGSESSSPPPFTVEERDRVISSLQKVSVKADGVDWAKLKQLISSTAHQSHKDWENTERASDVLAGIIGGPDNANFRSMFERVLGEGNWESAEKSANARPSGQKPWAVLVTGLNGIRKTTSVYQPWFKKALFEALQLKTGSAATKSLLGLSTLSSSSSSITKEEEEALLQILPDGTNSFFRQLDFMIATVANEEFKELYKIEDIPSYASKKSDIFSRYRMLAEMLGVLLVKEAQKSKLNVMVETSGKDVAMFHYVDKFFPDEHYNKLALHFTIDDIKFAEDSVDTRMLREMKDGKTAMNRLVGLEQGAASRSPSHPSEVASATKTMIDANAGGPYGSAVLKGVQEASDKVWSSVIEGKDEVKGAGESWYKASFAINASDSKPWTLSAIIPPKGEEPIAASRYVFERR